MSKVIEVPVLFKFRVTGDKTEGRIKAMQQIVSDLNEYQQFPDPEVEFMSLNQVPLTMATLRHYVALYKNLGLVVAGMGEILHNQGVEDVAIVGYDGPTSFPLATIMLDTVNRCLKADELLVKLGG